MRSAKEALAALKEGNRRYASNESSVTVRQDRREELIAGQSPFAIILGCADSRAPAELIFNQGAGDLFVVRVAGNIADASQIGSIEYAAEHLGTRLVVVMGHSGCGAVKATVDQIQHPSDLPSPHLASIVDSIRPAIEHLVETADTPDPESLIQNAIRANIRASADHLRQNSPVLKRLIQSAGLQIVGAEYSLETGWVDFFDGVPEGL